MLKEALEASSPPSGPHPYELSGDTYNAMRVRYFYINDSVRFRRDPWVEKIFPGIQKFAFVDDDTSGLSRSREGYDCLVIGGNDVPRLARFLRVNRNALSGVVMICVMVGANAHKRAQALMAGFDDVLDPDRMRPEEAVARVEAIVRRYQMTIESNNERARIEREMRKIANVDRLTDRERLLLEAFLQANGGFLSYFRIQSMLSTYIDEITLENVKVIVCNLRKKLKQDTKIKAKVGDGYSLIKPD